MKVSLYPMLVAGLLIIGGCKSPLLNSASNRNHPDDATRLSSVNSDWNPLERDRQTTDIENGSIRSARFETLAEESRQQTSPPGRVAVEDYLKRGHIAGRQGHIEEAKKFYDLVLRTDPDNVSAHHRLAVIADKQQKFQTAERHYQSALRQRPYDSDLLADIGYSYFLQQRFEKSEQYLSKALQSNPSHLRTLNNLGLLYGTMGDYERALAMLRRTGSESEAREKLAKIFSRVESQMSTSENNPANRLFSSAGETFNAPPVSTQFSSDSQLANPLASRELTAPNPRGVASRNSQAENPRSNQFREQLGRSSLLQENFDSSRFDSSRTVGISDNLRNSANPLRPAAPPTSLLNLPTDTYGELSGGIDVSWPQSETQPPGTPRLQLNQIMPQRNQPSNTFGQPIATDVRPVQEQASTPNRLLPAGAYAVGQTQFPNDGYTNYRNQNSYQTPSTPGSYDEQFSQMNPVNTGFPEYQLQQLDTNGINPTPGPSARTNSVSPEDARRASLLGMNPRPGVRLPAIDPSSASSARDDLNPNLNYSISNPSTQYPAFNQSGTTQPQHWQGDRYAPRTAPAYSDFSFQFPEGQTGTGLTAEYPNPAGNQPEAFRVYEQRRRRQNALTNTRQNAFTNTVQQFPQTAPLQQPGVGPAWPQGSQQFPTARTPRIQLGGQPGQSMADPSFLR